MFLLHYGFVSVIKWVVLLYWAFKNDIQGEKSRISEGVSPIYAVTGSPMLANMHKSGIKWKPCYFSTTLWLCLGHKMGSMAVFSV